MRPGYNKWDDTVSRPLLSKREVTRDSKTYTTTFNYFASDLSGYGNPSTIVESNVTRSRSKSLTHFNSTSKWIVGLAESTNIANVGVISTPRGAAGEVQSESRFGVNTTFGYSPFDGTLTSRTDANQGTTQFSTYSLGVARTETRPEAVTIVRTVDSLGNVKSQTDGEFTWGYGYDDIGRLTSVAYPGGTPVSISWTDGLGGVSKTVTRSPLVETTTFDGFGRVTKITRAGISRSFVYDALGRKIFESLSGSTTLGLIYGYDALGRVKSIRQTPSAIRTFNYSADSVTVTDERGFTTKYEYDRYGDPDEGYLTAIIPTDVSAKISMDRNEIGFLRSASQNGVARTYQPDSHWFVQSVADPEIGTTVFTRDSVGNMKSRSLGGKTITYGYDGLNRLRSINGTGISVDLDYNKRSKLTSVSNGAASRIYDYDADGNLKKDSLTADANAFEVLYAYDGLDGLSSITYPMSKGVVTYGPDALGRPQRATPFLTNVDHHDSGNLKSITFGNGVTQSYGEEAARQLPSSITASQIQLGLTYSYDDAGNVDDITNSFFPVENRTLGYDAINRLTSARGPWGSGAIEYDGGGNIKRQQFGAYVINYNYPAQNRLGSITGGVSRTYTYDTLGNIKSNGVLTFDFDDLSQLSCVSCGVPGEVAYRYDGQGKRVSQDAAGNRTYFVQAPNGDLQFEYTPYGKKWTKHVYLHGKRVASESGSDALASSTTVTSSSSNANIGDAVTLTATLSPSAATGTVEFIDGDRSLGIVAVASGRALLTTSSLTSGAHSITANYSGDANYQPSNGVVSVAIAKRIAGASLSGVPTTASLGQSLTMSATVTGLSPGGLVEFRDGTMLIGTVTLSGGIATVSTAPVGAGTHSYTATYLGDASNTSATSVAVATSVAKATPTVTVVSSAPNSATGQAVTFTATITGVTGITGTGSITFLEGSTSLGSAVVSAGSASFSATLVSTGTHQITARYDGDGNYNSVTSAAFLQVVQGINVALASNGGVASASSEYGTAFPASAVVNGDRAGLNWGSGSGWNDATVSTYPDWIQVQFNSLKTIDRVIVYTLQDNNTAPSEPSDTMTFTSYGVVDFTIEGWNGSSWIFLGGVTNNNRVKRTVSFTAVTVDRVRINITSALGGYSHVTEVEAWGSEAMAAPTQTNVALSTAGAIASASSEYGTGFAASAANNGDRAGLNWGQGSGWNDATASTYPDWLQVQFSGAKTIDRVVVYTMQDNNTAPSEPTDTMTFTSFGVVDFTVEGWNGNSWVILGTVTNNNLVKRTVTFSAFTTDRIRINVTRALGGYSHITEVEAWGTANTPAGTNVALATAGATALASSEYGSGFAASAVINGERAGLNWGQGSGWNDATASTFPDWVQVQFSGTKMIDRVIVYTLQDNTSAPSSPTDTMTFTSYGVVDFTVDAWNGAGWTTLGTVTNNNLVKRTVTFTPFATSLIRINVTHALGGYSHITEVEAWGN